MRILNIFRLGIVTVVFTFVGTYAQGACEIKESTAASGGYRVLEIGTHKLVDVDSFKKVDGKVFYATSPVYGKPEVGVIECSSDKRIQLVAPKNMDKSYPDGTDFFRLKDVTKNKKSRSYTVRYFYAPDIDSKDFKNLESKKNLKSVISPYGR